MFYLQIKMTPNPYSRIRMMHITFLICTQGGGTFFLMLKTPLPGIVDSVVTSFGAYGEVPTRKITPDLLRGGPIPSMYGCVYICKDTSCIDVSYVMCFVECLL